MADSKNKIHSNFKELSANQKISEALMHVNQALNFGEEFGDKALRRALKNFVEVRQLSIPELKNELVDALFNAEVAGKKIEIYEAALLVIRDANLSEATRPKGGRPKNPWAKVAFEQAKTFLAENRRLPTAKLLSKTVCLYALNQGYSESSTGEEAFSVSTAKDYLGYFKNSLPIFKTLSAEQWFSVFEGNFTATKYFGENMFPP